ncbi:MAG: Crp/Fnr family transcriptional regulator [Sulfurospirillum sp.]
MQELKVENIYGFLKNFSTEEKEKFFTHAKKVSFPKGQILFFQGDLCEGILYIETGSLKVYLQNDEGDEITLYNVEAGEQYIVNTSSTISQTPALGSAVTLSKLSGYILDADSVKKLMRSSSSYQKYMFSLFSLKLISLATLVEDLKFKPLKERVLSFLKNKKTVDIKITHEKIAQNMGTSRVVISRVLKKLENDKKLSLKRGVITVLD